MKNIRIIFIVGFLLLFTVTIVTIVMLATDNNMLDNNMLESGTLDSNMLDSNISENNISENKQWSVILRLDDFGFCCQARNASIKIIDTVLMRNLSITIGVVPFKINEDRPSIEYLSNKNEDDRLEIAQHGTYHSQDELLNLSEDDTYSLTKKGLDKLEELLGMKPITYIPPYEKFNNNTTKAISKLGFKIFAEGFGKNFFDGNMMHIKNVADYKDGTDKIINKCWKQFENNNLCVILIHPNDILDPETKDVNEDKYLEFIKILDELEKLNVRFITFKEYINGDEN